MGKDKDNPLWAILRRGQIHQKIQYTIYMANVVGQRIGQGAYGCINPVDFDICSENNSN